MSETTILVCDDEPHIVHVVSTKLRNAGFRVVTASDGEEAFNSAKAHKPALIVTDYQMPRLSGLEVCTKLRNEPALQDVPAILLTARGFSLDPGLLADTNIRKIVPKPFSPRELLGLVQKLVNEPVQPTPVGAEESCIQ